MGTNTAQMNAQNMGLMKYFLRALPVVMFPFIMHFPAVFTRKLWGLDMWILLYLFLFCTVAGSYFVLVFG